MATAKSNPFNDVESLYQALLKAPQDKEGAFRVSTWKMVIEEMVRIKKQLDQTHNLAEEAHLVAADKPSAQQIKEEIEKDLSEKMNAEDADTILF